MNSATNIYIHLMSRDFFHSVTSNVLMILVNQVALQRIIIAFLKCASMWQRQCSNKEALYFRKSLRCIEWLL